MSAYHPLPWIVLAALWLLLSGCSTSPLSVDGAIGTLPVPDAATDCQVRVSRAEVAGGGIAVQGSGGTRIVSVIGAENCSPAVLDEALGIRRVPGSDGGVLEELRALRLDLQRLGAEPGVPFIRP